MIWWIIIPGAIAAALVYAYWEHGKRSRHLTGLFSPLAAANGGTIKAATVLALPQLRFQRDGRRYLIGAMASAGKNVSGTASRPGFNGPFTFVSLEMPINPGQQLRLLRNDRLDRVASKIAKSLTNTNIVRTRDTAFDRAFRVYANDDAFVRRALDQALRQKLLNSPQQKLEVALANQKISVHIDNYANTGADLDEMIEIATLLAQNCP